MWTLDVIQLVQIVFFVSVVVHMTCYFAHLFTGGDNKSFQYDMPINKNNGHDDSYGKELTVVEQQSYHKYSIWRYYRFSRISSYALGTY